MPTVRHATAPLLAALLVVTPVGAEAGDTADTRSLRAAWSHQGSNVVVDEGPAEPRSIGSYAVRIYHGRPNGGDALFYKTGIVRPRDGTLAKLAFVDLDGDSLDELVVVMQSAGSGSYLAADAFRLRNGVLSWVASVQGLPPTADVEVELRKAAAAR
jgi:hypothetical protein